MKRTLVLIILLAILVQPGLASTQESPSLGTGGLPSGSIAASLNPEASAQDAFRLVADPSELSSLPAGECGQLMPLWAPSSPAAPAMSQIPDSPEEITVLTYNTHLFEGSQVCTYRPSVCHGDGWRSLWIAVRVRESEADIVALQEVWNDAWGAGENWQAWFLGTLKDAYPYGYYVNAPGCGDVPFNMMIGSGLVLLSKWPLVDVSFQKFPIYDYETEITDNDYWATKGVIAATALVGDPPKPIRIGISHAKTGGEDQISKWDDAYVGTAITPFQLDGQTYMFALKSDSDTAFVTRLEDYSYYDEAIGGYKYGAGYKDLIEASWNSNYTAVESFELDGHPYLFGLKGRFYSPVNEAYITRINDDPSTGWQDIYKGDWSSNYVGTAITSFELNGHPYLFALKGSDEAYITRINDDPSTGWQDVYKGKWDSDYVAVESFELNGHPWLFGLKDDWNEAYFTRINDDPSTGWTDFKKVDWDSSYKGTTITSFELNGQPYIFGLKTSWDQAWISRINAGPDGNIDLDNPFTDFEFRWQSDYVAIESFELNGQPYLFAIKDCCSQWTNHCYERRPGELYLTRIYEDANGNIGIEDVNQLDDMRIIRDATVHNDKPAIIMGDTNVHRSKYGFMNEIFTKAGAVDAYVAVHGTGEGGETIDDKNNKLAQEFGGDPNCPGTENCFDRIDYVYVKESPTNSPPVVEAGPDRRANEGDLVSLAATFDDEESMLTLVPTEATVIRDWKFDDGQDPDMDLSDHYPLSVTFELREQTHTATIDWGDGTQDTVDLTQAPGLRSDTIHGNHGNRIFLPLITRSHPSPDRSISGNDATVSGSHVYADNGVYEVTVCVSDSLGETGCDSLTITVDNVAPTVDAGPDQSVNEGSVFDLVVAFNDKGTLDTHTATIDWGYGDLLEDGLVSEVPFGPPGSTAGADGAVSGSHIYGDNGLFPVTVAVTDDDGGSGSDSFDMTVENVDPTAEIDESDAVLVNGMPTFLAHAGEPMDFAGRATDPGSDDLFLSWDWDDGSPVVIVEDLVHPPNPDPYPSPDVDPRDVTDTRTHTFVDACLYGIDFLVDDDDGGHGEDQATVIITGNGDKARSEGYWQHQYSGNGEIDFDQATLECYLAIASYASTVFDEERDASTIEQAFDVLFLKQNQGSEREQLDRELLTVWLNFANGSIEYLELLDTDQDGMGDTSFADVVAAAEAVRLDPGATDKEIREQTNILHHIKQMSD